MDLKRTPIYDLHVELGGRMVPFAGFSMPVQYTAGIQAEHRAVRERVGLFDVSHMGEFFLRGPRALDLLDRLMTNDPRALVDGQIMYTAMCREDGGIIDDLLVYRFSAEEFMVCVNAANTAKDRAWFEQWNAAYGVDFRDESADWAQIAVQGPAAAALVAQLAEVPVLEVAYYHLTRGRVAGAEAIIARTGYTGEDGFELFVPAADGEAVFRALLEAGEAAGVQACGLGCRDTLRLEVKFALYGNDIDETTHPLEAGLGWITRLKRDSDFIGKEALRAARRDGLKRRLVGFELTQRGVPRPHYPVLVDGEVVGEVCSGTLSPSTGRAIGTAYLPVGHHRPGTEFAVQIRKRRIPAVVVKTPFYKRPS